MSIHSAVFHVRVMRSSVIAAMGLGGINEAIIALKELVDSIFLEILSAASLVSNILRCACRESRPSHLSVADRIRLVHRRYKLQSKLPYVGSHSQILQCRPTDLPRSLRASWRPAAQLCGDQCRNHRLTFGGTRDNILDSWLSFRNRWSFCILHFSVCPVIFILRTLLVQKL